MTDKKNIVVEKSFEFALKIIDFAEVLENQRKYIVARQLMKSGTSIGANIREAQNAESLVDFIHKMKIAAKEADETEYWLSLCKFSSSYSCPDEPINKNAELIKLLSTIIGSSKNKLKSQSSH